MKTPRILVVDDDPSIRSLICVALKRAGFETLSAQDGAAAIGMCRREGFDLVVLDVMMPRMSGPQFLDLLQAEADELPRVIIVTALPRSELKDPGAVVSDIITKPFEIPELIHAVRSSLENPPPQISV